MTGADFGEVDIDLLADYIGGALDGTPEQSAVAARIADDPSWRAAFESLAEGMSSVTLQLGRLSPELMPTDLATRLDAMLTSSRSSDRAGSLDAGDSLDTGGSSDASGPIDTPHPSDIAPAATDLTSVAGKTGDLEAAGTAGRPQQDAGRPDRHLFLVRDDAGGEATSDDAGDDLAADGDPLGRSGDVGEPRNGADSGGRRGGGSDAGREAGGGGAAGAGGARRVPVSQPERRRGRRLRWTAPIAVAAGLIAFVGFGLDYLAGRDSHSASTDSAAGSGVSVAGGSARRFAEAQPTLATGIDYTHATLAIPSGQSLSGTLGSTVTPGQPLSGTPGSTGTPGRRTAPQKVAGIEPALQRLLAPGALADCLAAIEHANAGGPLAVESVDYARFAGAPAVIVRFGASNGRWAWASGADCGTPPGEAATLDKVPVG